MNNKITIILLVLATGIFLSCNRNNGSATVTVDTLVTDEVETEAIYNATSIEYEGILPCADCPGITTHLHLNSDSMTYLLTETYQGKLDSVFTRSGTFRMMTGSDSVSNIIELSPVKDSAPRYYEFSGDSMIFCLDKDARRVSGDQNYTLLKK